MINSVMGKFVVHRMVSAALLRRKRICQFYICELNLFIENILLTHITEYYMFVHHCADLQFSFQAKQENKKQVTITYSK